MAFGQHADLGEGLVQGIGGERHLLALKVAPVEHVRPVRVEHEIVNGPVQLRLDEVTGRSELPHVAAGHGERRVGRHERRPVDQSEGVAAPQPQRIGPGLVERLGGIYELDVLAGEGGVGPELQHGAVRRGRLGHRRTLVEAILAEGGRQ